MSPELDKLLCEKYPKIFNLRYGDLSSTAITFGLECNDGWFDLIDTLCDQIQKHIDHNANRDVPQFVVSQVKEKFGTLRFYGDGGDQMTDGMIWLAESLSGKLCETCGSPGKLRGKGWYYTACDKHTKKEHQDE